MTKLLYNSKAVRNTNTASNTVRNCACERKFKIIRDTKTFDSCSLNYNNTNSAKPSAEFLDAGSGCRQMHIVKMQVALLAEPKTPLESSVFI